MIRKKCELCEGAARMYCESDEASLCFECDEKVHAANFLVAKHTRCLLCNSCQSPTPWKASGPKLGPTISLCNSCLSLQQTRHHHDYQDLYDDDQNGEYDDDDEDDEDDEDDDDDDDDVENQVVPWGVNTTSSSSFPPPTSAIKRTRPDSDLFCSDDEIGCSSSHETTQLRPLRLRRSAVEMIRSARDQDHGEPEID